MVGGSIGNLFLEAIGSMGHGLGDLGTSLEIIATMDGPRREIGTLSLEAIGTMDGPMDLGTLSLEAIGTSGHGPLRLLEPWDIDSLKGPCPKVPTSPRDKVIQHLLGFTEAEDPEFCGGDAVSCTLLASGSEPT